MACPFASMRPRVFPAEDARIDGAPTPTAAGFNEAAGIPRGRRGQHEDEEGTPGGFNEAAGIPRGRHRQGRYRDRGWAGASMRPRVFPAEDLLSALAISPDLPASMRPRVFPAEDDQAASSCIESDSSRFNEAAGIPRGRRRGCHHARTERGAQASMRPRVFPAEDAGGQWTRCLAAGLASMRPRVFPAEDHRRGR